MSKEVMQMALNALQDAKASYWTQKLQNTIEALEAALAQPDEYKSVQIIALSKPVVNTEGYKPYVPPQRKWVGLTADDRIDCEQAAKGNYFALYAAIEAKLKEKNGF